MVFISPDFIRAVFKHQNWSQIYSKNVTLQKAIIMVYASRSTSSFFGSSIDAVSFSPTATGQNIFLLCLTAMLKIVLTAWTFGLMVKLPLLNVLRNVTHSN